MSFSENSLIGTTWQGRAELTEHGVRMLPGAQKIKTRRDGLTYNWVSEATGDILPVPFLRKPRYYESSLRQNGWAIGQTVVCKVVIKRERTSHLFPPDTLTAREPEQSTQTSAPAVSINHSKDPDHHGVYVAWHAHHEQGTNPNHMEVCAQCNHVMELSCTMVGSRCTGKVDSTGLHHYTWCPMTEAAHTPAVPVSIAATPQTTLSMFRDKIRACISEHRLRRTWSTRHGNHWHALMTVGVPMHKLAHEYFLAWSDDDVRTAKDYGVPHAGVPFEDAEQRTSLDWLKLYSTARDKDGHTIPIMLVGPAGCGKSTFASLLAEHLDLPLYVKEHTRDTSPDEIRGMKMPQGPNEPWAYEASPLALAYENGGVYLADEFDAGDANALCVYHLPLANGYGLFDNRQVAQHEHFHAVAACNTYGSGSRLYMGREEIDEATLSRFVPLSVGYDTAYEDSLWS